MKKAMAVYDVMPVGENWIVRRTGANADVFSTQEEALAAAERLAREGAHVRVLRRALDAPAA